MKWDDLLNVPFKWGGRDKSGMDCFGIVVECCRRAGTPIKDPFMSLKESVPYEEAERIRKQAINIEEVRSPVVGGIVYGEWRGRSHVGYIVSRGRVLHAIENEKPRVSPLAVFKNPLFYEVVDEEEKEEWEQ